MTNSVTQTPMWNTITDPMAFIKEFGTMIASSQMFGCNKIEQGMVLAAACLSERKSPTEIVKKYHLIHGKLSKKSEAMLAEFREAGGKHKIIQRDDQTCTVELTTVEGTVYNFSFTWADAQEEDFVYDAKEMKKGNKVVKDKYRTPRSRMQMLWARLVSDAIRCVAPEIVAGSYTPEEISDFSDVPESVGAAVFEGEAIQKDEQAKPEPKVGDTTEQPAGMCNAAQRQAIKDLTGYMMMDEHKFKDLLNRYSVIKIRDLTTATAKQMIDELTQMVAEYDKAKLMPAEQTATSANNTAPCSEALVTKIKSNMGELFQGGVQDIGQKVAEIIAPRSKISELSHEEATQLEAALAQKILGLKFGNSTTEGN